MNRKFGTEFTRILKRTADYLESFYQQKMVNRNDKKDASKISDDSPNTNILFIFESKFYFFIFRNDFSYRTNKHLS